MVHRPLVGRRPRGVRHALLVGEDSDQPAVAGGEVEVALGLVVEVGLLEDERHAQHPLPEVDRRLAVGPDEGDVVDALALKLAHPGHYARVRIEFTADLWWKNAVFYCLDVETFMDGDGDGCGDFTGLIQQVDYLAGLGVTCLWLMPFYPTPNLDDGYDISDYFAVDPRLGTLG